MGSTMFPTNKITDKVMKFGGNHPLVNNEIIIKVYIDDSLNSKFILC